MRRRLAGAILLAWFASPSPWAGVYKWVDEHGVVHYADRSEGQTGRTIDRKYIESRRIEAAPASPAPAAFTERVARECELRRERLEAHRAAATVYRRDASGQRYALDRAQRERQLHELDTAVGQFCGEGAAARLWAAEDLPVFLSAPGP